MIFKTFLVYAFITNVLFPSCFLWYRWMKEAELTYDDLMVASIFFVSGFMVPPGAILPLFLLWLCDEDETRVVISRSWRK